jgi:hypothetical protein
MVPSRPRSVSASFEVALFPSPSRLEVVSCVSRGPSGTGLSLPVPSEVPGRLRVAAHQRCKSLYLNPLRRFPEGE